jgi:hypothetical protein
MPCLGGGALPLVLTTLSLVLLRVRLGMSQLLRELSGGVRSFNVWCDVKAGGALSCDLCKPYAFEALPYQSLKVWLYGQEIHNLNLYPFPKPRFLQYLP